MHRATQAAKRTIAVLSRAYASSGPVAAEWQEAWRGDPLGAEQNSSYFEWNNAKGLAC